MSTNSGSNKTHYSIIFWVHSSNMGHIGLKSRCGTGMCTFLGSGRIYFLALSGFRGCPHYLSSMTFSFIFKASNSRSSPHKAFRNHFPVFFSSFKDTCDYIDPTQGYLNNIPILKARDQKPSVHLLSNLLLPHKIT